MMAHLQTVDGSQNELNNINNNQTSSREMSGKASKAGNLSIN
jgi:hypothetical protein